MCAWIEAKSPWAHCTRSSSTTSVGDAAANARSPPAISAAPATIANAKVLIAKSFRLQVY
jgi:hypothetical protein